MTTFLSLAEELLLHPEDAELLLYPEDDGNPMAESTEQYRWIVMVKENLELLLLDQADVFIAADLAWYPVQVEAPPAPCQAPDVMVAFGRPKGPRRSYLQWKESNIGPQVVFEILSESNKGRRGIEAMNYKFQFYERYGVEEYYVYDPYEFTLEGWQRIGRRLVEIPRMTDWVSPRLGVRFDWQVQRELELYYPDGRRFSSFVDLQRQINKAHEQMQQVQQQIQQAEQQVQQAEQQVQQERSRAEQAESVIQVAVPQLLGLGLTVEQVANSLGLPIEAVQAIVNSKK